MGFQAIQQRLRTARGARSRPRVVELLALVPGAPESVLDELRVRRLETKLEEPPADGSELRALCAALGVPYFEALAEIGYWPPLAIDGQRAAVARQVLLEGERLGWWTLVQAAGGKVIVEVRG